MSGLKPSLFGLKISTSRVRARSQTLAPIFPSGRFITRLLSRPYSKIRSVTAAKCPLPQKGYQKKTQEQGVIPELKKLFSLSPATEVANPDLLRIIFTHPDRQLHRCTQHRGSSSVGANTAQMSSNYVSENPRQASGFNAQKPQVVRVGRDQVGNTRTHIRLSAPLCGANRQEGDPKQKGTQIHKKNTQGRYTKGPQGHNTKSPTKQGQSIDNSHTLEDCPTQLTLIFIF